MILIPVKNLGSAKQRLSAILPQASRTELGEAMLQDVLVAVAEFGGDDVSLVTSDPFAVALAAKHGFDTVRDDANLSETDAIAMATTVCQDRGIRKTLVIPGDVPLIEAVELATIYATSPVAGSVLVPAHDRRGTNAIFRSPAGLFPLRFGNDSFLPHLAAAKATGQPCVVLSQRGIGLDIDTAQDLRQLASAPGNRSSQLMARKFLEQSVAEITSQAISATP